MKEWDPATVEFVLALDAAAGEWKRGPLRDAVVIVLDGDVAALERWVAEHPLEEVKLGVLASDDEDLQDWDLDPEARTTSVLMNRGTTTATLTEPAANDPQAIQIEIAATLGN